MVAGEGAYGDEGDGDGDHGDPVIFGEPDVEAVAGEVWHVAGEADGFGVHGFAGDDPADVRPPGAFLRSVRVAGVVAVLVLDSVKWRTMAWFSLSGGCTCPTICSPTIPPDNENHAIVLH